jgi:hypothetical protein
MKNLLFTANYVNNKLSVNISLSRCCLRHTTKKKRRKLYHSFQTQHFASGELFFPVKAFKIETSKCRCSRKSSASFEFTSFMSSNIHSYFMCFCQWGIWRNTSNLLRVRLTKFLWLKINEEKGPKLLSLTTQ